MKKLIALPLIFLFIAVFCVQTGYADDTSAAENWKKHCKKCHAEDGSGSTKIGQKMELKDYTDSAVQEKLTDEVILTAIIDGAKVGGKLKMKPYAGKLSEEEINDLLVLVRSFAQ